jgi:ubiquinone/menaquinone biosynthesis C-methylase UbiE
LFSAIAQQCFINEYVFAQSDEETRHSSALRDLLLQKSADGAEIAPLLLAAVAAYFPLHSLSAGRALLNRKWPQIVVTLVDRQLREPLAEADDLASIPVLTAVDDSVSFRVMQQYAENPYPRWTINPLAAFADEGEMPAASAGEGKEILIAGCGSGQHALQVAQNFPGARILAADISLPSLAYARRKTREEGVSNIEYVQADILQLETIGRSFDRVEAVGVLHHLAEPELGWRVLLSLLRPKGEMRVGLYSEAARRDIVAVRAFIAERGYGSAAEDIRKCRQEILRDFDNRRWTGVIETSDFYSMSGCRDLLFNVMEHRFTITQIKAFLNEQRLSFQGFEVNPWVLDKFQTLYPGAAALANLDNWQAFEADNPLTFRNMYVFTVRKD